MGIFGALFEFDLRRYHDVVIPAFRAGERHPVVASALQAMAAGWPPPVPTSGLTEALDYVGEVRRIWPCFRDELAGQGWDFESIALLYVWVVLRETVDAHAEVSSHHPTRLFDLPSRRAHQLVELLSTPPDDDLWMPGLDNVEITGWLEPAQTAELLPLLPPPDAEPDPIRRLRQRQALLLLEHAVDRGHGVLWATEITLDKQLERRMFADRPAPIAFGPFPRQEFPEFFDPHTGQPHPETSPRTPRSEL